MRLARVVPRILNQEKRDISHNHAALLFHTPRSVTERYRTRIEYITRALLNQAAVLTRHKRSALENYIEKLNTLSPLNILKRGYSITRVLPAHSIVTSARQVQPGDKLDVTLREGELCCNVLRVIL